MVRPWYQGQTARTVAEQLPSCLPRSPETPPEFQMWSLPVSKGVLFVLRSTSCLCVRKKAAFLPWSLWAGPQGCGLRSLAEGPAACKNLCSSSLVLGWCWEVDSHPGVTSLWLRLRPGSTLVEGKRGKEDGPREELSPAVWGFSEVPTSTPHLNTDAQTWEDETSVPISNPLTFKRRDILFLKQG